MDSSLDHSNPPRVQLHLSARASGPREAAEPAARQAHFKPPGGGVPFIESGAREVFEIMLGTPLNALDNAVPPGVVDHTAMIGLAGQLCGVLSIRCPKDSASRLAQKMLGLEKVESDECVRDALGALCNMVAGSLKSAVLGPVDNCLLSVPTVLSGKDYQLYPLADGERVEVMLAFDRTPMWITLDLHS